MSSKYHELKIANRLPSPSGTALAIIKLMQNEEAGIREIGRLVQADPALSGRILRLVNSASMGLRRPIVSVQNAAIIMGVQVLRNLALSFSLVDNHQHGKCQRFDYSAFWSESLALAASLSEIMGRERTISPDEAFTFGLLSNIGALAMATAWPDEYSDCLMHADEKHLLVLEQEYFMVNHDTLGLMLLEDWGIPKAFLDALIQSRQNEDDIPPRISRFAFQIRFARDIAGYLMTNPEHQAGLPDELTLFAKADDLDENHFSAFIDAISRKWHDWGKLIDIKTPDRCRMPSHPVESAILPQQPKLLLVDNDPLVLDSLSMQLADSGFRVEGCLDGALALQYAIEHKPQIVITDNDIKPMSGVEFCKILRSSSFGKTCYVIMLTASDLEEVLLEAFDSGIDDYLTKPVNFRVFLARIRAGQRIVSLQNDLSREYEEIERSSTELAVLNRNLALQANTDQLTGLPNRRYAQNRLEREWAIAQRIDLPLSILMLDLDYFKSVNDNLGHDVGDQVLAHTAKLIRKAVRAGDIACRLGGEEFLVIAVNTDSNTALMLAERIRSTIEKNQLAGIKLVRPVTVSIGISVSSDLIPDWKEMLKQADQALYQIKNNGRNGILCASS